jgi:hypothetical protein
MNLAGWLNQTITVQSPSGSSDYGDPTWGAKRDVRARVELTRKKVRSAAGELVDMTHMVFTTEAITINDRIWVPGTTSTVVKQARRPVSVMAVPRKDGVTDHYETAL